MIKDDKESMTIKLTLGGGNAGVGWHNRAIIWANEAAVMRVKRSTRSIGTSLVLDGEEASGL